MTSDINNRKSEKTISWIVLLCLVGIGIGIFQKQKSFNPAVLIAHQLAAGPKAAAVSSIDPAWLPPEVKVFGTPEQFTPDNLYDKIDGKAELYVSTGVARMDCQRFALKDKPDEWFEWFCYGMNGVPQAFSVFSTQRRSEGETLDLTPYAYRTKNAIFFAAGTNYVEVVGSSGNESLLNAILAMAKNFVAATSASGGQMAEMQLLPTNNLVAGSITLQTSDAFGFDQFKNVFTAQYNLNGAEAMAFVTTCASPDAANTLRDAYRKFLLDNGGKEAATANAELGSAIEIMGTFEIIFCQGNIVAGVHSAPNLPVATQLAGELQQRLKSK
ncbi:MAG TPA: DUF6599 family protein [Candidatus Paceibacterota bacterium]|nr:DUF6599 family protein [Candidatus Paceibacterota bacterium]